MEHFGKTIETSQISISSQSFLHRVSKTPSKGSNIDSAFSKLSKGKEMLSVKSSRMQIERKIAFMRNRIKHINKELQSSQQKQKLSSQKLQRIQRIRRVHLDYKSQLSARAQQLRDQQLQKKELVKKQRQESSENRRRAKDFNLKKKQQSMIAIKLEKQQGQRVITEIQNKTYQNRRFKALSESHNAKNRLNKRNFSHINNQQKVASEYESKLLKQNEIKLKAQKKLVALETEEARLLEVLKTSSELSECQDELTKIKI